MSKKTPLDRYCPVCAPLGDDGDWIEALDDLDTRGDETSLVALLESGTTPSPVVLKLLADLVKRRLSQRGGRRSTPSYKLTKSEERLYSAVKQVVKLVKGGLSIDKALDQVNKWSHINHHTLGEAYNGSLGSFNKLLKRLPALKRGLERARLSALKPP